MDPSISKDQVKDIVRHCERCQSIDPAPVVHSKGELSVQQNWKRLAIDVTHYRQVPYLSVVDCGPGRYAIWRKLRREDAEAISDELESIFYERGPVDELLLDKSTAFRSQRLGEMLACWNVIRFFRAAYRPSGNGIVERHHRTVKVIAERASITPIEAVYWYNSTPRVNQDETTVPQRSVMTYQWRCPCVTNEQPSKGEGTGSVKIGDEVWVKPPDARCTSQWSKGVVTDVASLNNISVNGMPRHYLDIRPVLIPPSSSAEVSSDCSNDANDSTRNGVHTPVSESSSTLQDAHRYPQRNRRPPAWMSDYENC